MHIDGLKEASRLDIKEHKNLRLIGFKTAGETNLLEGVVLTRLDATEYVEVVLAEEDLISDTEFEKRSKARKEEAK